MVMSTVTPYHRRFREAGSSMIEVLVAIVILSIGLLGLASLQGRLQAVQIEAYQRGQALIIMNDMAGRLSSNRANAVSYVTSTPLGVGTCPTAVTTRSEADLREWCLAIQGYAERRAGQSTGAMSNGLGCIDSIGNLSYRITVTWQGVGGQQSDPGAANCADGSFGSERRRAVTTIVTIGAL